MRPPPTDLALPGLYLRQVAAQVRSRGADVPAWLARSGLSEARLDDPALAVPFERFRDLLRDALAVTREPALGLFVGQRLEPTMHGILGYAALSSGTIRQALELVERFVKVRIAVLAVSTEVRRGEARLCLHETHPLGDVQRPVLEAVAMTLVNVVDSIAMGIGRVRAVTFPFGAPDYADLARELFGCEVRYRQRIASLSLPAELLDVPLRRADPIAFRDAAAILQRELDRLVDATSVAGRVRRILLEGQHGFPSLGVAARQLHMTPRTLHRRLVAEGASFRELLEEVRHRLAVEHLEAGHFTIEEIAYRLGYADLANFRRAFKRWESVPPSAYRQARREARVAEAPPTAQAAASWRSPPSDRSDPATSPRSAR